jgi:hypothetical protein
MAAFVKVGERGNLCVFAAIFSTADVSLNIATAALILTPFEPR